MSLQTLNVQLLYSDSLKYCRWTAAGRSLCSSRLTYTEEDFV